MNIATVRHQNKVLCKHSLVSIANLRIVWPVAGTSMEHGCTVTMHHPTKCKQGSALLHKLASHSQRFGQHLIRPPYIQQHQHYGLLGSKSKNVVLSRKQEAAVPERSNHKQKSTRNRKSSPSWPGGVPHRSPQANCGGSAKHDESDRVDSRTRTSPTRTASLRSCFRVFH